MSDFDEPADGSPGEAEDQASLVQVMMRIAVDSPETLSRLRMNLQALFDEGRLTQRQHDDLLAHFKRSATFPIPDEQAAGTAAGDGSGDDRSTAIFPAAPRASRGGVARGRAAGDAGGDDKSTAIFPAAPRGAKPAARDASGDDKSTAIFQATPDREQAPVGDARGDDKSTAVFPATPRGAKPAARDASGDDKGTAIFPAQPGGRQAPAGDAGGEDKSTAIFPAAPRGARGRGAAKPEAGDAGRDNKSTAVFPAPGKGDAAGKRDSADDESSESGGPQPLPAWRGGTNTEIVGSDTDVSSGSQSWPGSEGSRPGRSRSGSWSDLEYQSGREQPTVGATLKDRFILQKLVGEGGMGLVFKALDLRKEEAQDRDPHLALKILSEEFKKHPDSLKALQREARKSQILAHPHIVNVFDFDRDGDTVFMTMEFLDGMPLSRVIERWRDEPLDTADAFDYIRQMAAGLAYAHAKGLVHSDFKPGNVFLTSEGVVKIIDFGIAIATAKLNKSEGEKTLFDARTLGALTPAYASLEMIQGKAPEPSDDIYALGCTAYELLSGRHPYDKVDASRALELGMKPEPLDLPSRNQWRAIARMVALRREDRFGSVGEFLEQFDERWHKKWGIQIAAGVAVAAIVAAATLSVPGYLAEREYRGLVRDLRSPDAAVIDGALSRIDGMAQEDRESVLAAASNSVLRFFDEQARAVFDPDRELFDFPAAQAALARAAELYGFNDAARQFIDGKLEGYAAQRNRLLNRLDSDFAEGIASLESGDYSAADSLDAVLEIVAQVSPEHPLLQDGRLAPTYATVAQAAIDAGDYAQARLLLTGIMRRFPDNPALREELDRADLEERRVAQAVDVFLIEAEVSRLRSELDSLGELPALAEVTARLAQIDPENSELSLSQRASAAVVTDALQPLLDDFQFVSAQRMLEQQQPFLAAADSVSLKERIAAARDAREVQLEGLLQRLRAAAGAGEIGSDSQAVAVLAELQAARAGRDVLDRARTMIFEAHIQQVNSLRAASDWSAALARLEEAAVYATSADNRQLLDAVGTQIEDSRALATQALAGAERQRLEQERAAEIAGIEERFAGLMGVADVQIEDVEGAIEIIERLSAIDPSNAIVASGREDIARQLALRSASLRDRGQYEAARRLVLSGLGLLPASAVLAGELQALRNDEAVAAAEAAQRRVASLRREVDLALRDISGATQWNQLLRKKLEALEAEAGFTAGEARALRRDVAEAFADAAATARTEMRFTDARTLIQRGQYYDGSLSRLDEEFELVQRGERELRQQTERAARLARVEGLKQTLRTQAQALDVQGAEQTFGSLESLAPEDPFLASEAPELLVAAYMSLAEVALEAGRFHDAGVMVRSGLRLRPNNIALQGLRDRVRAEELTAQILDALSGVSSYEAEGVRRDLEELRDLFPGRYDADSAALAISIARRLRRLAESDPQGAASRAEAALRFFPQSKALRGLSN